MGSCCSYLKGSAKWWREETEDNIKSSNNYFKNNKISDFRKNEAKKIRDEKLKKISIGFLHQAFRYRGKANYRDAIYLSYGIEKKDEICRLNEDLYLTLSAFIRMASHYCSKRVERGLWEEFIADLEQHSLLSHDLEVMRGDS